MRRDTQEVACSAERRNQVALASPNARARRPRDSRRDGGATIRLLSAPFFMGTFSELDR
jgi:hypothetical protein